MIPNLKGWFEMNGDQALTTFEKLVDRNDFKEVNPYYLSEWRNNRTLLSDKYFNEMLKILKITKKEFTYSLQPQAEKESKWVSTFTSIMNSFDYENIDYTLGIYVPVQPITVYVKRNIQKQINKMNNLEVSDQVIDRFIEAHLQEMQNLIGKIIAVKLEEYKLNNKFSTSGTENRFSEFIKNTFKDKNSIINLYEEYPVLARVITTRTMYLMQNWIELLERVNADYLEIEKIIKVKSLNLTDIKLSTGDSHEKGNSVSVIYFNKNKLIYKPRNLQINSAFEIFFSWLQDKGKNRLLDLKLPRGIYKNHYTYNEFIASKKCASVSEVMNYYIRYGYLIAICYLFGLNDMHVENIVAFGEYPVIIDIETAFQVPIKMEDESLHVKKLRKLGLESVSSSFLLPTGLNVGLDDTVDLSALSGKKVELKQKILTPVKINTDQFHYEKGPSYFPGGNNIPKDQEGHSIDYKKYLIKIVEGFDEFVSFTRENKNGFISILSDFKGKRVRSLVKSTEKYASMIRYSNHPNYNKQMKYRERLMMNLWAYPYDDKRIVESEIKDLLFNDIPIFYSFPESRSLIDSSGKTYKNYFDQSGMTKVKNRILTLSGNNLIIQRNILLSSLGLWDQVLNEPVQKKKVIVKDQYFDNVKLATKMADRLIEDLVDEDAQYSMFNIDCDEERHWKIQPINESLYGGISGLALFYLNMYLTTTEKKYFSLYKRAIHTAVIQCKETIFLGAFDGWLSALYPLMIEYKYFKSMQDTNFFNFTLNKLSNMSSKQIDGMERTDYISGVAGIITLLSSYLLIDPQNKAAKLAIDNFSSNLLKRLDENRLSELNKVGIAHGISGTMLALVSAGKFDKHEVKRYLHKEFTLISRNAPADYKWCWGLSGMIQARIKMLSIMRGSVDLQELNSLIELFKNNQDIMVDNNSLCHGNGSVLTTMKMIYKYTGDTFWSKAIDNWSSELASRVELSQYWIPTIENVPIKGLFDGICGIGWLFLYLKYPIDNVMLLNV